MRLTEPWLVTIQRYHDGTLECLVREFAFAAWNQRSVSVRIEYCLVDLALLLDIHQTVFAHTIIGNFLQQEHTNFEFNILWTFQFGINNKPQPTSHSPWATSPRCIGIFAKNQSHPFPNPVFVPTISAPNPTTTAPFRTHSIDPMPFCCAQTHFDIFDCIWHVDPSWFPTYFPSNEIEDFGSPMLVWGIHGSPWNPMGSSFPVWECDRQVAACVWESNKKKCLCYIHAACGASFVSQTLGRTLRCSTAHISITHNIKLRIFYALTFKIRAIRLSRFSTSSVRDSSMVTVLNRSLTESNS